MSLLTYKVLHLLGLFLLFGSLGGVALVAVQGGTKQSLQGRRLVYATHGIGLLLVLVSGFGMLARLGITSGLPGWVWAKLVIWLLVAASITLPLRARATAVPAWFVLPLLGAVGGWLALNKPF